MAMQDFDADAAVGTEIEGFRITGVLGRGGMGVVYEAEDLALGRTVALKMIDPVFARDEVFLRRFQSEARALARINEPHIVQVYALRHTDAGSFIVMECVDGGTLGDRLARGPIPVREALPLIRQMLKAFGHAHELGVIHRDIKPGNIMLTRDGTVKITDFGLARIQQAQPSYTVTQAVAGTLYYMSPEQVKGLATVDHRSDLYALGMTIYEMLTGRLPFERQQGEFQTMRAIVEEQFPPPHRFNAAVPPELSRIILKALEKDPARRHQSAAAMLADVDAFDRRGSDDTATVSIATPYVTGRTWSVGRIMLFAAAALALIGLVGAGILLIRPGPDDTDTDSTEPPPVVEPVSLSISTEPGGALVRMDGREIGTTPLTESLVVGEAGVRVEVVREGYRAADTLLFPSPGDTVPLHFALTAERAEPGPIDTPPAPGTLVLGLVGDGVVRVGGRSYTGAATVSLPPGRHTVQCGAAPYDLTTRVTVRPGAQERVTCHFDARIGLNTRVEGSDLSPSAAIWVDDVDTGLFTPREIVRGPGSYRISVRKFGYEVQNQEEVTIRPSLEPQPVRRLVFRLRESA